MKWMNETYSIPYGSVVKQKRTCRPQICYKTDT